MDPARTRLEYSSDAPARRAGDGRASERVRRCRSLAVWVRGEGALAPEEAVGWAIRVLKALELRHERGLPHGNLCAAAIVADSMSSRAPAAFVAVDTRLPQVGYYSPERLDDSRPSVVSDVWAVGVLLYLLLTGERPFPGTTRRVVRASIAAGPPPTLVSFGVADAGLQRIVDRLFAPLPSRVVCAASLRQELERWMDMRSARDERLESGEYRVAPPSARDAAQDDDDDPITVEIDLATGPSPVCMEPADPEVTVETIDDPELVDEIERLERIEQQAARSPALRSDPPGARTPAMPDPQAVHALQLVAHLEAALAARRSPGSSAPRPTSTWRPAALAAFLLLILEAAGLACWLLLS